MTVKKVGKALLFVGLKQLSQSGFKISVLNTYHYLNETTVCGIETKTTNSHRVDAIKSDVSTFLFFFLAGGSNNNVLYIQNTQNIRNVGT